MFGCPTQSVGAAIRYNNSTHEMSLGPDDPDSSTKLRINSGDGAAAMYVDSVGRVLVGTNTQSLTPKLVVQGQSGSPNIGGYMRLVNGYFGYY